MASPCDRGDLVLGYADLKAVANVVEHGGHGLLVGLSVAHSLNKFGHGDGRKLNIELLEQLALVAHGGPEVERTGRHLQDARVLEGLDHVAHGQKVPDAALELGIGQAAVGHIGKGNLEAAQNLAGGEQAALAIAQAGAVGLGALVARAPQQHRQTELAGKAGANVLGAKVGVAQHDAVDALGAELLDDRLDMAVVKERPSSLMSSMSTMSTPISRRRSAVRPRYLSASGALKMLRRVGTKPSLILSMYVLP